MMDTEEKLAFTEIEQGTNKYKKHINDLIEDAEIEAEMEAKKKNSLKKLPCIFDFNAWVGVIGSGLFSN